MKQFGEADQVFIACALNGELYTDIGKSKDNRGLVCANIVARVIRFIIGYDEMSCL